MIFIILCGNIVSEMNQTEPMYQDLAEVLITREKIQQRVEEMGQAIARDYAGKTPLLLCLLKGSFVFIADIARAIPDHVTVGFMGISSYGSSTRSSGEVKITKDLSESIEGRHVIVVEDIIDTGLTLSFLMKILKQREPASLKICTFLNKPARRIIEVEDIAYEGFTIEDHFVVGYGLDYNQKFRNLPCIGILKPEVYQKYQVNN